MPVARRVRANARKVRRIPGAIDIGKRFAVAKAKTKVDKIQEAKMVFAPLKRVSPFIHCKITQMIFSSVLFLVSEALMIRTIQFSVLVASAIGKATH